MIKMLTALSTLRSALDQLSSGFSRAKEGATAIEYALMASGIGVAVAATVWSLGSTTKGFYASLTAMLP